MLNRISTRLETFHYKNIHANDFLRAIPNLWEIANFSLGFLGLYKLLQNKKNHKISKLYQDRPLWLQKALKINDLLGNLSLVLGGLKSGPAIKIWKWNIQKLLSSHQIECFFGSQGYLPGKKIYCLVTMISFSIGLPSTLQTLYTICRKIVNYCKRKNKKSVEVDAYSVAKEPSKIDIGNVFLDAGAFQKFVDSLLDVSKFLQMIIFR